MLTNFDSKGTWALISYLIPAEKVMDCEDWYKNLGDALDNREEVYSLAQLFDETSVKDLEKLKAAGECLAYAFYTGIKNKKEKQDANQI